MEESKYCTCTDIMKKHFNKELVMNLMKLLETLLNVEIVIMIMLIVMLRWQIFAISLETIEVLHIEMVISMYLKNYDSYLSMQKLGKFNL